MYSKICYILLISGYLQQINASRIEKDPAKSPFVFKNSSEIKYEIAQKEFSYKIDMSVLDEIREIYYGIKSFCWTSPFFQPFYNQFFREMTWNLTIEKEPPSENIINFEPKVVEQLKTYLRIYISDRQSVTKCHHLFFIAEQITILNREFKNLKNENFESISKLIPTKTLLNDSFKYTNNTNLTHPIEFSHWFTYNFYKYVRFSFKVTKNYVFLTLKIPLYTDTVLSNVYVKPVIYNNVVYISNSESQYVIENQTGTNYFSNFFQNCFYAKNKTFCNKPMTQNFCDNLYLSQTSNTFYDICFDRRPFQNIITQIKNDIYFLVVNPLPIDMICNGTRKITQIFESSKILNNDCLLNATFYVFDKNSTLDYGIFVQKTLEDYGHMLELEVIIQFYIFLTFMLFYVIFINVILYCYYKTRTVRMTVNIIETEV